MSKSVLKPDVTNENREKVREAGVKYWTDCSILPKISAISIRFFFFLDPLVFELLLLLLVLLLLLLVLFQEQQT